MMRWKQWLAERKLITLIGLTGVDPSETKLARLWGNSFRLATLVVAVVLLLQWQMDITRLRRSRLL